MAKPIKETPVLIDEDAARFEMAAQNIEPVSNEEKERARKAFEYFRSIATFSF